MGVEDRIKVSQLGMTGHTCNANTQEAEAGGV
jgi:hypothetical protein